MLFRRRDQPGWGEKLRVWLWPRHSWRRSAKYIQKRVLRLNATPHAVAAGFAAGTFASFTPFIGFHLLICAVICVIIRGNVLAAVLGTFVGNPLTAPIIWVSTYELGEFLLGNRPQQPMGLGDIARALFEKSFSDIVPLLKSMAVGGVVLGTIAGLIAYVLVRWAVIAYQGARRRRLEETRTAAIAALIQPDNEE